MGQENILIPLAPDSKDLKALHHAISLAERINSKIIVYSMESEDAKNPVIEACKDVINRGRENGLKISFLVTSSPGENTTMDFLQLLDRKRIDLIVLSDTEEYLEKMVRKLMPSIFCQVVQVKEKDDINHLHG